MPTCMLSVYTVIVTYNGAHWIEKCLQHLLQGSYKTSIIVVDNCSTDDTFQILEKFKDNIYFIQAASNLGFGAGNNLGILKAFEMNADLIFLLNQDAYVAPDCIEKLVSTSNQHPEFGIISPLQLTGDGTDLDHAFKGYLGRQARLDYKPDELIEVRFVNAASWMIPARVMKKVGLFHKAFLHYGEDNHYCSRMHYHGYKVGIFTGCNVQHDRVPAEKDSRKTLIRQLRTVPLYTLLDVRKNFLLAWTLGYYKLARLKKKMTPYFNDEVKALYQEQKNWFLKNINLANQIRKETKQDAVIGK